MSITIDAKGFSCPQPVLMFMKAAAPGTEKEIIVHVDTDASKENVSRAAQSKGYTVKQIRQQGDEYQINLVKD